MDSLKLIGSAASIILFLLSVRFSAQCQESEDWQILKIPTNSLEESLQPTPEFAWLRCYVKVPSNWADGGSRNLWAESVVLFLEPSASIQGYEVFLNGRSLGGDGSFDSNSEKPLAVEKRYKIPPGTLVKDAYNLLALRVHPTSGADGFFRRPPVLAGYHHEIVLEGNWEYRAGDHPDWAFPGINSPRRNAAFEEVRPGRTPMKAPAQWEGGPRLAPEKSMQSMKVSEDLQLDLVLSEPEIAQPVSISFDEKGRLWVVEYRQYPYPAGVSMVSRDRYYRAVYDQKPPPPPNAADGRDRITIHADSNNDGRLDRHKVFVEGLNITTSALRGRGGVWVLTPPYLVFYPDRDFDDKPDGDPIVHLDGFGLEDTHSVANNLRWGPDGWLYGAQGSTTSSRVKAVLGREPDRSTYLEGPGIWRYHPERHTYEIFAEGGGNSFGLEFDAQGQLYSGHNGGNTRGFHYHQGAYYEKSTSGKYGPLSNPYAFGTLPPMEHDPVPRFTHALVIYEAQALPDRYHGKLLGVDPLHRRVVMAEMIPDGSTFRTEDIAHPLESSDPAFRPVDIKTGPDGAVYVADFYEYYIAHGQHFQGQLDKGSGRIYRLRTAGQMSAGAGNLHDATTVELMERLFHADKWHRQTALRLLGDRKPPEAVAELHRYLHEGEKERALDLLWALNLVGGFNETVASETLNHANHHVRAWTVRLVCDNGMISDIINERLASLAVQETNVTVRSQLAASAKRLPVEQALPIVRSLTRHHEDRNDPHIPQLLWWTLERHCNHHTAVKAMFDEKSIWEEPMVHAHLLPRLMQRYAMSASQEELLMCADLLQMAPAKAHRQLLLDGFEQAFQGRSMPSLPPELAEALARYSNGSMVLQIRMGNAQSIETALSVITDSNADKDRRMELIRVFGEVKEPGSVESLLEVFRSGNDVSLRAAALNSLQTYSYPGIARVVLELYSSLNQALHLPAQNLLASRESWALGLLSAMDTGKLNATSLSEDTWAKLRSHSSERMQELAEKLWDSNSPTTKHQDRNVARYMEIIRNGTGDPYRGKEIFNNQCAVCHRLYDNGGSIGPALTSYQRDDLPSMLLSITDPNAEIREGYEYYLVETKDDRLVSGFVSDQNQRVLIIRGLDGQDVVLPKPQIHEVQPMQRSLMPEGLLDPLSEQEVRDLFSYLRSGQPVN